MFGDPPPQHPLLYFYVSVCLCVYIYIYIETESERVCGVYGSGFSQLWHRCLSMLKTVCSLILFTRSGKPKSYRRSQIVRLSPYPYNRLLHDVGIFYSKSCTLHRSSPRRQRLRGAGFFRAQGLGKGPVPQSGTEPMENLGVKPVPEVTREVGNQTLR